jgi:putative addiction module component (TIGR02574 family)
MQRTVDTLTNDALSLPEDQRLTLAHRLLSSLEPQELKGVEAAWDLEIQRRIQAYDQGLTQTVPASDVFQEVDKRLSE